MIAGVFLAAWLVAAPPAEFTQEPAALLQPRDGLPNLFAKLAAGQPVTIAYFGGSITAMEGWRTQTFKWFQETWPQVKFTHVHAAIGGTPSMLGVYRNGWDVLRHKPDLVFVEFSVNDGGADPNTIFRAMEGIVRQTWRDNPHCDICYVYTFRSGYEKDLTAGLCPRAPSAHEKIAAHYGIPSINVALKTTQLINEGREIIVPAKDAEGKNLPTPEGVILFSNDGVHPLPAGHQVYTDLIVEAMGQWRDRVTPTAHRLPEPYIADNWEAAKMAPLSPAMLTGGWQQLPADNGFVKSFGNRLPAVWQALTPGDKLTFRFRGTDVGLYDLLGPDGANVRITLDGVPRDKPVARFDSYCTYHRLATLNIGSGLEDKVHEVTVEVLAEQPNRSIVTDKIKDQPNFDPRKYDGTALRVGAILLIGEVVE